VKREPSLFRRVRQRTETFVVACALTLFGVGSSFAQNPPSSGLTPAEAIEIATDAYVYGYSLITTEVTRVQMSNVDES
jgi:hypothetical protein